MLGRHYGIKIGVKKLARIRRDMGIKTIYRHNKISAPAKSKEGIRPYLLKSLQTIDVDKVWSSGTASKKSRELRGNSLNHNR